jgi:diamine N-acetyltransferase
VENMNIRLRPTKESDLNFVLSEEQHAANSPFVRSWTYAQHLAALESEDLEHSIIERIVDDTIVGYLILAGRTDENQNIEFRRIVIVEKNKGYGRVAVCLVKQRAFEELKAHRLWLDVKEHNSRARHLYETEGFRTEGVLRECLKAADGFESLVVMSMLREEYLALA